MTRLVNLGEGSIWVLFEMASAKISASFRSRHLALVCCCSDELYLLVQCP